MSRLRELYSQKAAPARSGLVATLNDPYPIAVVLFCLFCLISLLLTALRWNERYVTTHPDGIERPGRLSLDRVVTQVDDRRKRFHPGANRNTPPAVLKYRRS